MINTFNLEQNLLTFPSERDILTGGRGGVSATEDGWPLGRLLACPRASVRAAALPAGGSQATRRACNGRNQVWLPERYSGPRGHAPRRTHSRWCVTDMKAAIREATVFSGDSQKERQDLQTQNSSAGQQGSRLLPSRAGHAGLCGALSAPSQLASSHLGRAAAGSQG